jgi:hypothetical protein
MLGQQQTLGFGPALNRTPNVTAHQLLLLLPLQCRPLLLLLLLLAGV